MGPSVAFDDDVGIQLIDDDKDSVDGNALSPDFGHRGTERSVASLSRSPGIRPRLRTLSNIGMMASPYVPDQTENVPNFAVAPNYWQPDMQEQLADNEMAGQGWSPDAWSCMMPGGESWVVDDMGQMCYTGAMYAEDWHFEDLGTAGQSETWGAAEVELPSESVDEESDPWSKEEGWRMRHHAVLKEQSAAKTLEKKKKKKSRAMQASDGESTADTASPTYRGHAPVAARSKRGRAADRRGGDAEVWPSWQECAEGRRSSWADTADAVRASPNQWFADGVWNTGSNGGQAKEADASTPTDESTWTTVMLRNVPAGFSRNDLLRMFDDAGFAGEYNFAYLPVDFDSLTPLKHAFVNLCTPSAAQRLWENFDGLIAAAGADADEPMSLAWNERQQGLEALLERYQNSPVMHESVPDVCKPILLSNGEVTEFPAPTKRIKAPKLGKKVQPAE